MDCFTAIVLFQLIGGTVGVAIGATIVIWNNRRRDVFR